jgi:hypothetical protein
MQLIWLILSALYYRQVVSFRTTPGIRLSYSTFVSALSSDQSFVSLKLSDSQKSSNFLTNKRGFTAIVGQPLVQIGSLLNKWGLWSPNDRSFLIAFSSVLIGLAFWQIVVSGGGGPLEVSYASFLRTLSDTPGSISNLRVAGGTLFFSLPGGRRAVSRVVTAPGPLLEKLVASGVQFSSPAAPSPLLVAALPLAAYALVAAATTMQRNRRQQSGVLGGPQTSAGDGEMVGELIGAADLGSVSFADVGGQVCSLTD